MACYDAQYKIKGVHSKMTLTNLPEDIKLKQSQITHFYNHN